MTLPPRGYAEFTCALHEALAAEVRSGLRDMGMPQSWLAHRVGLSEKHVCQMLSGRSEGSLLCWSKLLNTVGRHPFPKLGPRALADEPARHPEPAR